MCSHFCIHTVYHTLHRVTFISCFSFSHGTRTLMTFLFAAASLHNAPQPLHKPNPFLAYYLHSFLTSVLVCFLTFLSSLFFPSLSLTILSLLYLTSLPLLLFSPSTFTILFLSYRLLHSTIRVPTTACHSLLASLP